MRKRERILQPLTHSKFGFQVIPPGFCYAGCMFRHCVVRAIVLSCLLWLSLHLQFVLFKHISKECVTAMWFMNSAF